MSYGSRNNKRYRRRRRQPAILGATAFASVILLALGGLTLVGLDTVGSKGTQLARVVQPEIAQVPEVTREQSTEKKEPEPTDEKSGGEQASAAEEKAPDSSKEKASAKDSDEGDEGSGKSSDEKSGKKQEPEKQKAEKQKAEKQDKPEPKKPEEPQAPPPPQTNTMWMSIPRLGMQSDTVFNSSSHEQMGVGAIKLPPTGFPWQSSANTYISAHRIGYPGTQSDMQFYALPAMQQGDMIYVGDANGTQYKYRVINKFAVKPWENWVTEPKAGEDLLTLQTCIDSLDPSTWWDISPKLMRSGPDSARMIVRAEKVDTYYPQQY